MKKHLSALLAIIAITGISFGEIVKTKVIDEGGSGPYKAFAASESTLADHTIYRPRDIVAAAEAAGPLPVLFFANGGCSNSSITHERVLSEIASHGYIVIAVGALEMSREDYPNASTDGEDVTAAIDWIESEAARAGSDYHRKVDLNKMALGGQSCGGAQILAIASDPRVRTYMMFNSGMGEMSMAGADRESLKTVHGPIVYIVGGPSDVATRNAEMDYENINHAPVAFADLLEGGHMGTFGEEYGGSFSRMALAWLDWQLKGMTESASIFLDSDLSGFPGWETKSKHFEEAQNIQPEEDPSPGANAD